MKISSIIFLQAVIVLIGIGALAFMLWEPHVEGANAHATLFQMYFNSFVRPCMRLLVPLRFCGTLSRIQVCWNT